MAVRGRFVTSINYTTRFVDNTEMGEEKIFRNRRRVTTAYSRLLRFIVLALIALILQNSYQLSPGSTSPTTHFDGNRGTADRNSVVYISELKNDSADKDNDDCTYGVNESYDGEVAYHYPKQEEYENETEYKHDWEVFERFSLNYGSANELSVIINCSDVHDDKYKGVVIPDEKSWKLMNKVYRSTMTKHRTDEKKYDVFPRAFGSALSAAVEVRIAPGEGRGIFATNDIAEGSVVWKSTNTAEFRSGDAFRNFVMELSTHDKRVACDALNWSYLVKASPAEYTICIDLDEGGMFNDGMGNAADTNVGGINRDVEYGCNDRSLYTSRNIPAGAQLKVDYGSFVQSEWNILGVCQWGQKPPFPGCETAANITYLKDDGIKERVGYEYEVQFEYV